MEPDEALEKLADATKMCKVFVNVFNDRRKNLASYLKKDLLLSGISNPA